MGSGHVLIYAFDVLMEIYRECGYRNRDAVAEILQHNLYGLDIDELCSQLAYFAIMMKGRSYDPRFFERKVQPQVYHPGREGDVYDFGSLAVVDTLEEKPDKANRCARRMTSSELWIGITDCCCYKNTLLFVQTHRI